jgi:hypothetical protein
MSMTRSSRGREQQVNRFPAAGGSSGSGSYFTDQEINPHSQVWQTPVRHDQRTGTSQASASSSRLWNLGPQETVRPARAIEILGPLPGDPAGTCGGRRGTSFTPGVMGLPEPKISVWMRSRATPQPLKPAVKSSPSARPLACGGLFLCPRGDVWAIEPGRGTCRSGILRSLTRPARHEGRGLKSAAKASGCGPITSRQLRSKTLFASQSPRLSVIEGLSLPVPNPPPVPCLPAPQSRFTILATTHFRRHNSLALYMV